MVRARNTESKRSTTPFKSFFQSTPASVMGPRLMVGLTAIALLVIGLVMVYSASSITSLVEKGDSLNEALRQCLYAVVGTALAVIVVLFVRVEHLRGSSLDLGKIYWAVCVVLMVATALVGTAALGAKRWLYIGPIGIQISEFAKIAFVIMAARIAEDFWGNVISLNEAIVQAIIYVVLPIGFLFIAQSDLGTTMICCVGLIAVIWLSGVPTRWLLAVVGFFLVAGTIAVLLEPYRAARLFSFLDPWADERDTGYQLVRSFKALAAGGLFGAGVGNSYEKLQYLPEAETDFIFAIIGEELGLVGTLGVIVLFLVFLRGGLLIAQQARSQFSGLVAVGLTSMIVFQAFLNIACVVGLFPTTGKPLPFISSGGSSLLSSMLIVGILLAISLDSHNEGQYRQRRENLHVVSAYAEGEQPALPRQRNRGGMRSRSVQHQQRSQLQVIRGRRAPALDIDARQARALRR